jgi:hypothetical protein
VQIAGVGIALALIAVADLHHQLAILCERQELVVSHRLEPRQAVGGTIMAAQPHEAVVDEAPPS